jgi:hypothetical protein
MSKGILYMLIASIGFVFSGTYSVWQFIGIGLVLLGMILNVILTKSHPSK